MKMASQLAFASDQVVKRYEEEAKELFQEQPPAEGFYRWKYRYCKHAMVVGSRESKWAHGHLSRIRAGC